MSPWFKHVNATKKAHPSKSLKEVLIMASKSYKKTGNSMKKTTNKSHKKKRSKSMKKNTNKSHKKKGGKSLKKTTNKSHKKKRSKSLKKKSKGGGKKEVEEMLERERRNLGEVSAFGEHRTMDATGAGGAVEQEQLVAGPKPSKLGLLWQHNNMRNAIEKDLAYVRADDPDVATAKEKLKDGEITKEEFDQEMKQLKSDDL